MEVEHRISSLLQTGIEEEQPISVVSKFAAMQLTLSSPMSHDAAGWNNLLGVSGGLFQVVLSLQPNPLASGGLKMAHRIVWKQLLVFGRNFFFDWKSLPETSAGHSEGYGG